MTDHTWRNAAKCFGQDSDLFDTENLPSGAKRQPAARRLCQGCPVMQQCAQDAIDNWTWTRGHVRAGYAVPTNESGRKYARKMINSTADGLVVDPPLVAPTVVKSEVVKPRRVRKESAGVAKARAAHSAKASQRAASAIQLATDGASTAEIAESLGVSMATACRYLASAGMARSRGIRLDEDRIAAVEKLTKEGLTADQIATRLGVSSVTVRRDWQRIGVAS